VRRVDDPVSFELFSNAIFSIADEMALTIYRTAYSGVLKGGMDFSTAFADADGRMVAQGLTQPNHLGSIPTALETLVSRFRGNMAPEDIFLMNDPFDGGMHLPDIFIFKPIYFEGELLAFAATICHHTDVGGRVAGSNASDSTEIYQEGLRIPLMKMFDRGVRNETLYAFIEKNVRMPAKVFGDLRSQLSACHTAELQFLELVHSYGVERVREYLIEINNYTERLARAAIAELPDGTATFEDWIDDDGVDVGKPIRVFVTVTKSGDRFCADWTGTAPQVKGAINNTLSFTKAAVYCAIKTILPPNIANNEGVFRAIDVIAPLATIANNVLPAACAARGLTGFRMVDCMFGALAQLFPDKVFAASDGGNTGISIGGYFADRTPFIYVDFICGAWGGRPWADGLQGNANMFSNISSHSVEMTEAEQPMQILAYEFCADRSGAGKYRGGAAMYREYKFLEDEAVLQVRADRNLFHPYGLYGGEPGECSRNSLNPGSSNEQALAGKVTMKIRRNDVFRHELPGGGGWGDPLERDPAQVQDDVRNGYVSASKARTDYGVEVDAEGRTLDHVATKILRRRIRAERGWTELPFVTRNKVALVQPAE
jgi:N-methylhydantoinase B